MKKIIDEFMDGFTDVVNAQLIGLLMGVFLVVGTCASAVVYTVIIFIKLFGLE